MTAAWEGFVAHGIRIEPASGHRVSIPFGGPVWDGLDPPDFARHLRGGVPIAEPFERSGAVAQRLSGTTVWGGYAATNFGNFMAEYAPRIPAGVATFPQARFLFLLPAGRSPSQIGSWFWQALEWMGVRPAQVVFCIDQPLVVDELHFFPQGEFMGAGGEPCSWYLDLLDRRQEAHGLGRVTPESVVYVSRAGMGHGALGGESYLEESLSDVGVHTIRPERIRVAEQLAWYARAETLVFAEGSAVHGRQLLGRRPGPEVVVMRRKGQRFCRRALEPRCSELRYFDALDASVYFRFDERTGKPTPYNSFPLVNGDRIVELFASVGVDLSPVWRPKVFRSRLEADLESWARTMCAQASPATLAERVRLMEGSLYSAGMQKVAGRLAEIARSA